MVLETIKGGACDNSSRDNAYGWVYSFLVLMILVSGAEARGSSSFILAEKLKGLKSLLKVWNREVFGSAGTNKQEALKRLSSWEVVESNMPLSPVELDQKLKSVEDFKKWALLEEISWHQSLGNYGLRRGTKIPVSFINWQTPIGGEISLIIFALSVFGWREKRKFKMALVVLSGVFSLIRVIGGPA